MALRLRWQTCRARANVFIMWWETCVVLPIPVQVEVFKDYFGELEEESIRDNFVIIYELLDETMDFGYPQTMESKILREYITQVT